MSVLTQASLVLTPNAVKASKLYSIIPSNGNGDMTVVRATTATRVNSSGLIESVAANVPRLNYDGSCPSILVEPQRTNLVLRSEDFSNVIWQKLNSSNISLNTNYTNPSGSISTYKYTASNLAFGGILRQALTITSATTYTFSFFCKKDNYRYIGIRFNTSVNNERFPNYDFDTDTLNTQGVVGAILSRELFSNGWVKLVLTYTSTTTAGTTDIGITSANGSTAIGLTGTESVYIWGPQLELGSYPTSYIPTVATSVTRNTDSITRNNIYTNGLITSTGGTWFIELNNNIPYIRDNASATSIQTSSVSALNGFVIKTSGGGSNRCFIGKKLSNVESVLYVTLTNTVKIAIDWNGTTADVFVNGVKVVTATSFPATIMEFFTADAIDVPKYIKSMMLFPKPLTDAECIALTTL